MGIAIGKPKRIHCFTEEQQKYFDSLSERQRKYVEYRGKGYNKTRAYALAGYNSRNVGQAAYNLEMKNKGMTELIDTLINTSKVKMLLDAEKSSKINQQVDALAAQDGAEKVIQAIEGADSETAKRIQFYRDISAGKIKTVKKTIKKNKDGEVVGVTIEEISNIDDRMKARKELDRILGLNSIIDIDKFNVGAITVNIVDASKKEELEDERNRVCLNPDEVEVIDGEKAVVVETTEEVEPKSKKEKFETFLESEEE